MLTICSKKTWACSLIGKYTIIRITQICIIQKREYLLNEKRYPKNESAILLYFEKPFLPHRHFNRHELSGHFSWSAVTCSSAGSHHSFQLCFSMFEFVFQVAVASLSSWFHSLNAFGVSSSSLFFRADDLHGFLETVTSPFPPPHPPSFFTSTDSFSADRRLEWGLVPTLQGFARNGSGIVSRG